MFVLSNGATSRVWPKFVSSNGVTTRAWPKFVSSNGVTTRAWPKFVLSNDATARAGPRSRDLGRLIASELCEGSVQLLADSFVLLLFVKQFILEPVNLFL